jgi:type VI secretion system protein ImpC
MVDTSSQATATGADLGRLDALVRHLVSSQRTSDRVDGKAVDAAVREIDAAIAQQIDEVLHHPEMRRLEAAWRGLRFLTDRTDFEHPVHIDVICAGREEMLSIYDELIHTPEAQGLSTEPVSFVVVDQIFDKTPEEIDLLNALAERGAALSVPVLTSVGAPFLGLSRPAELARTSGLAARFKGPEFVKWNGLRESGASRWLGVVFNRMLLRPAHGPADKDPQSYAHVESIPSGADEIRAWGNPVWALASLCTRSFARIGWCTDIMGQRAAGTVEDLPLRLYERPGAENASFPLEAIITDEVERDLSNNGTMTLSAALNGDKAFLRFAPTVHTPQHYQDPSDKARARLQSTLPFQMFVGRLINYAMMIEGSMVPGRGAEQIAAGYDRALRGLLATAGAVPPDAVAVAVPPNEADPSRHDLHLKVRWPGFQSLPGAGDLELRWPLMG